MHTKAFGTWVLASKILRSFSWDWWTWTRWSAAASGLQLQCNAALTWRWWFWYGTMCTCSPHMCVTTIVKDIIDDSACRCTHSQNSNSLPIVSHPARPGVYTTQCMHVYTNVVLGCAMHCNAPALQCTITSYGEQNCWPKSCLKQQCWCCYPSTKSVKIQVDDVIITRTVNTAYELQSVSALQLVAHPNTSLLPLWYRHSNKLDKSLHWYRTCDVSRNPSCNTEVMLCTQG